MSASPQDTRSDDGTGKARGGSRHGIPVGMRRYLIGIVALGVIVGLLLLIFVLPNLLFRTDLTGRTAPDISLDTVDGGPIHLYDILGNNSTNTTGGRVVLLDFFSLSCSPCKEEMKTLSSVWAGVDRDRVAFISIDTNSGDSRNSIREFKDGKGYTWAFARDTRGVSSDYKITAIPTIVIIGADRVIISYRVGGQDQKTIEGDLDRALDTLL